MHLSLLTEIDPEAARVVKTRFGEYANRFRKSGDDFYNRHMELKQYHTERVVDEILLLGSSLGMNTTQLAFLEIIAWLHDIGRFEQYHRYGTFADAESENHASIALRVIEQEDLLKACTQEQAAIIYRAILNHNLPRVPANEMPAADFYSRVLRDADKLDIWRVAIEVNIFHRIKTEKFPETYDVPDNLFAYFEKGITIPLAEVKSFYDSILFRLSWVYDLNFSYTLSEFRKRHLGEKFISKIPHSPKLDEIEALLGQFRLAAV